METTKRSWIWMFGIFTLGFVTGTIFGVLGFIVLLQVLAAVISLP